jgi:hypothetical protein
VTSTYAANIYPSSTFVIVASFQINELTSSPDLMGRIEMTWSRGGSPCLARGNTITAFGRQEWLIKAGVGEIAMPIGLRVGVVKVNEFVVN